MNVTQMRYALEIERTGSISRAARNLYMAQPNLSASIKELEDSLGIRIFNRSSKGVRPTHEGQAFLDDARDIVRQLDTIESRYGGGAPNRSLRISSEKVTYVALALSRAINGLPLENVPPDIEFNETSSMGVVHEIASGEADLGICRYQDSQREPFEQMAAGRGLHYELIWRYPMLLVVSAKSPLAELTVVPLDKLGECTEVIHWAHTPPEREELGKNRQILVYDRGGRMNMVSKLNGAYMWNPPVDGQIMDSFDLVVKRTDRPGPIYADYVIYKKDRALSLLEREFVRQVKADTAALLEELEPIE